MISVRTVVCLVLLGHKTQKKDQWEMSSRGRPGGARPKRAFWFRPSKMDFRPPPHRSVFLKAFSINVDRFYGRKKERKCAHG